MTDAPSTGGVTAPRTLDHAAWMAAAREEYARLHALLSELAADDWRRPTACAGWDVHAVVAHLVGAAESNASLRELLRQTRLGLRLSGGDLVDRINAVQVRERTAVPPARLVEDLADAGRRGVAARSRIPGPLRALPLPFGPPLGVRRLGYLMDRIYTRDAWMHRMDLCAATGRTPRLTARHDGRIVEDVVAEWAAVHGRAYDLLLEGPAGGRFGGAREGAEVLRLDAVEFCRTVSGRGAGTGLLAVRVPF